MTERPSRFLPDKKNLWRHIFRVKLLTASNSFVRHGKKPQNVQPPFSIIEVYSNHSYNHGQKSLGQSERNFNSMRFTSSVAKSSAVFLQIHVPSPLLTQYNVERSKELCLDGFNTVFGVGGGEGVGTYSASSTRIQFRVNQLSNETREMGDLTSFKLAIS